MKLLTNNVVVILLSMFLGITNGYSQQNPFSFHPEQGRTLRIMFYNVENAFDTLDNPNHEDNEFLPTGARSWNWYKYQSKIEKVYKVIIAAGGWDPPGLIGLCEIESRQIMEDLVHQTPFSKYQYKIVHKDSPDFRGIDVAAVYREEKFMLISSRYISVPLAEEFERTRDILYLKGLVSKDTLHTFFNHWPSRWQGELQSRPKRIKAAQILYQHVDSILSINAKASIVIAGDFNDNPGAESLTKHLRAQKNTDSRTDQKLVNLSAQWEALPHGTYKYQGIWQIYDQFIVSGSLLDHNKGLSTSAPDAQIVTAPFLLEEDEKYTGWKPFRTYSGYRYIGGFSDHLPVILNLH